MHACISSVVPNSVQPYGLSPARLLCPWNSPGKNTGVGCHSFLQGLFLTQGSNLYLLHWQADFLPSDPPGKVSEADYLSLYNPTHENSTKIQSFKKKLSFGQGFLKWIFHVGDAKDDNDWRKSCYNYYSIYCHLQGKMYLKSKNNPPYGLPDPFFKVSDPKIRAKEHH